VRIAPDATRVRRYPERTVTTAKRMRKKENRRRGLDARARSSRRRSVRRRITQAFAVVIAIVALAGTVFVTGGAQDDAADDATDAATTETTLDPSAAGDGTAASADAEPLGTPFGDGECAPAAGTAAPVREFAAAFRDCLEDGVEYRAVVSTNHGDLTILLDPSAAPGAVNNFVNLARSRYFDDTTCHRVIPTFVVQCGDPTATGAGGPGYRFTDELPAEGAYEVGSIAMANAGPDTNGSQFFIVTGEQGATLPPSYTLFGRVTDGLATTVPALDALGNPDPAANGVPPLEEIRITRVVIETTTGG
jgi:cyclophilin family peptidyl-prolyl cis-trans isomerase